jgi:hypothetical protein
MSKNNFIKKKIAIGIGEIKFIGCKTHSKLTKQHNIQEYFVFS